MTLSRQFQASLLFYEKILSVSKRKSNQNQPTKAQASEQKTTKGKFRGFGKRRKIGYFTHLYFLYAQNFFIKKNWLEIVLIASFTILLSQKLTSYFCWL